ncbi:MAG: hypothetical protein J0H98_00300 [Solirubrobacterales bacterium]|nr:hypothetical protein [Solirubrobacterales bacterium]
MRSKTARAATLIAVGLTALAISACGSDDSSSGPDTAGTTAQTTGATGATAASDGITSKEAKKGGEITPGKKAPASAKDKKKHAPDSGISDRPGGPKKPVSP